MKFAEILRNEHFNNLAAIIRVHYLTRFYGHPGMKISTLHQRFLDLTQMEEAEWNKAAVLGAFTDLLVSIVKDDERMSYTEDDIAWFAEVLDSEHAKPIIKMFQAWYSAPDTLLTPVEVAEATDTAESTWRNKAARGDIPGAVKKGKQWLLPRSVLRAQGVEV